MVCGWFNVVRHLAFHQAVSRPTFRCSGRLTRHALLLTQKHASPQTPLNSGVSGLKNGRAKNPEDALLGGRGLVGLVGRFRSASVPAGDACQAGGVGLGFGAGRTDGQQPTAEGT